MKFNKKLKWSLGLVGLTAMAFVPMSVALVSCGGNGDSSSDQGNNNGEINAGFEIDENGIIQPLTRNDITPTQYNFDNRLTSNTAKIIDANSLEEANQILNDRWNSLSDEQKIACIKNDIQNWFNFTNLYNYNINFYPFLESQNLESINREIPTWKNYENNDSLMTRNFTSFFINSIELNNDNSFKIDIKSNSITQFKTTSSDIVNSQVNSIPSSIWMNCNVQPSYIQYKNNYYSSLKISFTNIKSKLEYSNWLTSENTPINEFNKRLAIQNAEIVNSTPSQTTNETIYYFLSPYLNIKFNITNSK